MRQILQDLKSGSTKLIEVPCPGIMPEHLLISTTVSLVSAGTERMLVDFGRAGYLEKARQQPEKVRQVLDKIRTDGLMPTIDAIRAKMDQPIPLGYSNVGKILDAQGSTLHTPGLQVGGRVVSNGPHAEVVCVPQNLCVKVPDEVSDEEAAFSVVGAIGLQGVRLAQTTLGECFVVIGLGLIGLLTVQILRADGCRVLGIDLDSAKCKLARQFDAETVDLSKGEDPIDAAMAFSKGSGVDGVVITAATKSSEPVHQAAQMCRKRGRIVLVGVTGLELNRSDFYEKELSFQVSCSYGPGRYDGEYEEKGHDYPIGYVRWTEQRNFEAVLDLMASGKLDVKPFISHRFPFEEAEKAYELIAENKEPYVGIILNYDPQISQITQKEKDERVVRLREKDELQKVEQQRCIVGLIGAGNFTGQVLLPALKKTGVRLKTIASSGGVSGTHLGKKFGFEESTTDVEKIFADTEINTVFITTRHNTHARFVLEALKAGNNVFVEKPLCISFEELKKIELSADPRRPTQTDKDFSSADFAEEKESSAKSSHPNSDDDLTTRPLNHSTNQPTLMVGFNRRFAPHVIKMKQLVEMVAEPKSMVMTVNAGLIPKDHWTQDMEVGGGRIIGEACHFIDLLRFLAGAEITDSHITRMTAESGDTVSIQLGFKDCSIGAIHYFANGNKRFPKESLEVFAGGKILQLDNFKTLTGYGWKNFNRMKLWRQDKGHGAEVKAFLEAVKNSGPTPIPFDEIIEVTRTTIELANS